MKYFLFFLALLAGSTTFAQTFPVDKTFEWDANPAIEGVISYTFQLDNGPILTVSGTPIAACNCIRQIASISASSSHSVRVTAINFWAESVPTILTFNASSPGKSGNIRIK